ncbi:MAG: hypothetical protein ACJ79H_06930 [Myxococcales bacterium]
MGEQRAGAAAGEQVADPAERCGEEAHQVAVEAEVEVEGEIEVDVEEEVEVEVEVEGGCEIEGRVDGECEGEGEFEGERATATGSSSANNAPKCTVPSGAM